MTTTTLVIAETVLHARAICKKLNGATRGLPTSARSIRCYGSGRGLVVDTILVDQKLWPLDDQVMYTLGLLRVNGAPMLLWPTGEPAPEHPGVER